MEKQRGQNTDDNLRRLQNVMDGPMKALEILSSGIGIRN